MCSGSNNLLTCVISRRVGAYGLSEEVKLVIPDASVTYQKGTVNTFKIVSTDLGSINSLAIRAVSGGLGVGCVDGGWDGRNGSGWTVT